MEQWMSKTLRAVSVLALVAFVAACAKKEEPVYVTEPVHSGPVQTGKYK
jgi:hypothetical protein